MEKKMSFREVVQNYYKYYEVRELATILLFNVLFAILISIIGRGGLTEIGKILWLPTILLNVAIWLVIIGRNFAKISFYERQMHKGMRLQSAIKTFSFAYIVIVFTFFFVGIATYADLIWFVTTDAIESISKYLKNALDTWKENSIIN